MRSNKIKKILEKNFKIKISKNKNFKLTKLKNYDSFTLVKIIVEIESIEEKKIPLKKLNSIYTIKDLLNL
jgi:acyl carrier protein